MKDQKVNTMELKRLNRSKIFHYLYQKEPQSKQDIAYALHMSFPTVAQNIRELQEQKLIMDAGMFESTGGRKAQAIVFNPDVHYAVGLDVTRNHIGGVVVDLGGNIKISMREKCPFENTAEYYKRIAGFTNGMVDGLGIEREKVLGVGIAVPAIVSADHTRMTYSPLLGMETGDLASFEADIDYPCVLCNDANSAGFAETWNKGEIGDMIYLSLNNSVGGCIILNNVVNTGKNQRGGEFGHITIVPNGKRCYCGQRGCMDVYCNAKILAGSAGGNLEQFFSELRGGSEKHLKIWREYLTHLATGVNDLRMAFDCDVVIGGYVGACMSEEEIDGLRALAAERNTFERDGSYIKACNYKSEATAVGAALHYIDLFLKSV